MEAEIYNKAKKIDKEIAELQDCKLLLMKGCNIELLKDGKNLTVLTFENDLREQNVKNFYENRNKVQHRARGVGDSRYQTHKMSRREN